jgi:hypothetical protein
MIVYYLLHPQSSKQSIWLVRYCLLPLSAADLRPHSAADALRRDHHYLERLHDACRLSIPSRHAVPFALPLLIKLVPTP